MHRLPIRSHPEKAGSVRAYPQGAVLPSDNAGNASGVVAERAGFAETPVCEAIGRTGDDQDSGKIGPDPYVPLVVFAQAVDFPGRDVERQVRKGGVGAGFRVHVHLFDSKVLRSHEETAFGENGDIRVGSLGRGVFDPADPVTLRVVHQQAVFRRAHQDFPGRPGFRHAADPDGSLAGGQVRGPGELLIHPGRCPV